MLLLMDPLPKKTRRVFNEPGHAHYLTFSCQHGLPLLSKDRTCQWTVDAIDAARKRHEFDLYAYVIMPEHVHLLVRPRRSVYRVEEFLKAIKRPVSWNAKQFLLESGSHEWFGRLTVTKGKRKVFRFWEAGGGFDRNITRVEDLRPIADYIHENPVRRGLVAKPTDWPWSSARFYAGMGDMLLGMDSIPT
jgi:putative transposase